MEFKEIVFLQAKLDEALGIVGRVLDSGSFPRGGREWEFLKGAEDSIRSVFQTLIEREQDYVKS